MSFHAVSDVCAQIGWPAPRVVQTTGSTNADLVGSPGHGQVLVALEQTAGRGRLDRVWVSQPGDGLTFSVRLDVPTFVTHVGWVPLLAGVAVADAVRSTGAQSIGLKWPNDVLGGSGKLAGILGVIDGSSAIVGIGVNLHFAGDRPDPAAVSVAEMGGEPDADPLLARIVQGLHSWWGRWADAGGDAGRCGLRDAYLGQCVTVGADVRVQTPTDEFAGKAVGMDDDGRLLVAMGNRVLPVSAADVTITGTH